MYPIQRLIQAERKCLIEKSKGYESVNHSATKGGLRETILIDFFRKLIPASLSISSGIICDSSGKTSNQTDFIIYDNKILPNIILDKNISMIPVESVYLIAEIKSTLRKEDLTQVETLLGSLSKLKLSIMQTEEKIKIPLVIIAYENIVAEKTLTDWMTKQNNVISICIINEFCISKTQKGIERVRPGSGFPEYWEALVFSSQMFNYLSSTLKERNNMRPILKAV